MSSLFRSVELVNTQTIPLDTIDKLSISYVSEAITIYETDGDALVLKEYSNEDDPSMFAQITRQENSLIIRYGDRPLFSNMLRGYVEVYLPRSFYGTLNVKTVSGKIEAAGRLVLGELAISNTSGKIELGAVTAGGAVLSTVSGAISVQSLKAQADVHSTSGSIRVYRAEGDGQFKNVSGSVEVSYQAVTGDISASSISGRVRLGIPALLSFQVMAKSVSGTVHVPFAGHLSGGKNALSGTIGNAPQIRIKLSTVSGRIEIIPTGG